MDLLANLNLESVALGSHGDCLGIFLFSSHRLLSWELEISLGCPQQLPSQPTIWDPDYKFHSLSTGLLLGPRHWQPGPGDPVCTAAAERFALLGTMLLPTCISAPSSMVPSSLHAGPRSSETPAPGTLCGSFPHCSCLPGAVQDPEGFLRGVCVCVCVHMQVCVCVCVINLSTHMKSDVEGI